jgi:hypothetical protein
VLALGGGGGGGGGGLRANSTYSLFRRTFDVLCSTLLHLPPLFESTVSEDAGLNWTVATLALPVRCFNHSARFHPHWLDLIHTS